ncbi:MAG: hypothetical protein ACRDBP_09440 [Luteolibacter sp.]
MTLLAGSPIKQLPARFKSGISPACKREKAEERAAKIYGDRKFDDPGAGIKGFVLPAETRSLMGTFLLDLNLPNWQNSGVSP